MKPINTFPILVAFLFLMGVCAAVHQGSISPLALWVYLGASAISFIAYAIDKSAARKGTWRIRERTLHLFALAGGWPGALVAQQAFRHKTKKTSFRFVFRVTVILNCCGFAWLFTPEGEKALRIAMGMVLTG